MRLATKQHTITNFYKPQYFSIKKDKKLGVIVDSPRIDFKTLTESQQRIQWVYNTNYIWEREKEGYISKENLYPYLTKILEVLKYSQQDINIVNRFKENDIPLSILSSSLLLMNGYTYKPSILYIHKRVKELLSKHKSYKPEPIIKKESIKDSPVSILIDEIQGYEDNIFKQKIDFKKWIVDRNITREQAICIAKFYSARLKEVQEIRKETCEQLNYAYRKYTSQQKTYMLKWYLELVQSLLAVEETVKQSTSTKVRKSKPKTPDMLVKKIRYSHYDEIGIKSINPVKIIGSTILWIYNKKTRKLLVFHNKEGYTLSIEGTKVINYDEKRSTCKNIRKPELQIREFMNRGKKPMLDYYSTIRSKEGHINGRITSDMVLLKTF